MFSAGFTRSVSARLARPTMWMAGGFLLLGGCSDEPGAGRPAASQPASARIEVETVLLQTRDLLVAVQGTLFPAEEALISTKVGGALRRTAFDLGETVAPGDAMAEVDSTDYVIERSEAQAALDEVLAQLGVPLLPDAAFDVRQVSAVRKAAAQLSSAQFTYDRVTGIGSAYSAQEINDVTAQLRVAEAELAVAMDSVRALLASARENQARVQAAERRVANSVTRAPPLPSTLAPDNGGAWRVAERLVTEGQFVGPAEPLYRLIITSPLKLRCQVPEPYARYLAIGQLAREAGSAGAERPIGNIARLSPSIDPQTRTVEIEILVVNADTRYTPGAFLVAEVVVPQQVRYATLPRDALRIEGGRSFVYLLVGGIVREREVRLGAESNGQLEIIAGLADQDQVVTRGAALLFDGMAAPQFEERRVGAALPSTATAAGG